MICAHLFKPNKAVRAGSGLLMLALLKYNGCRATPGCEKYATKVANLMED